MACRKDYAVSVCPCGSAGSVAEDVLPESVGGRCETHRSTGVAAVGLFDGVNGEEAYGVDGAPSDIAVDGGFGECWGFGQGEGGWVSWRVGRAELRNRQPK